MRKPTLGDFGLGLAKYGLDVPEIDEADHIRQTPGTTLCT